MNDCFSSDELEQQANEFQKVTAIKVKQIKSENKKVCYMAGTVA